MKPKYTDSARYPNGYVPSDKTDITRTWDRARKELDRLKAERQEKVRDIKQLGVKRRG